MKISQKTDYALRALYVLVQRQPSGDAVRTAEIAKREKIPMKFLEAILVELRHAGLVQSQRGAEGGHRLARPASEITVGEVWRALDGPLSPAGELSGGRSEGSAGGAFQFVWEGVETAASGVVDAVSLAEVVRRAETRCGALDFSI
jgi:Rrf2 family protein